MKSRLNKRIIADRFGGIKFPMFAVAGLLVLAAAPAFAQHHLGQVVSRPKQASERSTVQAASHSEEYPAEYIGAPMPLQAADGCGGSCSGGCGCDSCSTDICPPMFNGSRFWVRAEGLSWWLDGYDTPALVTTSTAGTDRDDAGVLGQAGTSTLFSGSDFSDGASGGGRYAIGTWLNPCRDIGLEFNFFHVEGGGTNFIADSSTAGIVARPFLNVTTGAQDAELVVFPSVVTGSLRINAETEFSGGELIIQRSLGNGGGCNLVGLFGYRFQNLEDSLQFTESITSIDTSSPIEPGTTFDLVDQFRTENEFHGAELGILAEICRSENVSFELMAKVAIGNTRSRTAINGSTRIVTPSGSDSTNSGALLALPSNIGTFERDNFSVVPEIALRMNYQLACNWQLQFGYTFIYWSEVARVGSAIDPTLNLTQLPPGPQTGASLPVFGMDSDDFWAQGFNLGLQYDF